MSKEGTGRVAIFCIYILRIGIVHGVLIKTMQQFVLTHVFNLIEHIGYFLMSLSYEYDSQHHPRALHRSVSLKNISEEA